MLVYYAGIYSEAGIVAGGNQDQRLQVVKRGVRIVTLVSSAPYYVEICSSFAGTETTSNREGMVCRVMAAIQIFDLEIECHQACGFVA